MKGAYEKEGKMDLGLKGKVAIVTRAAGGIGGAIARDLARQGVDLSLCYHNKSCDGLIEEIQNLGQKAIAIRAVVSRPGEAAGLVKATHETFGRVDILVNNAGISLAGSVENTKVED
jgi:NAD(P)-dependent dehydrogenase (short-subunit alcohol dehydrogenase family)